MRGIVLTYVDCIRNQRKMRKSTLETHYKY
ncbi:MAG: hypothetical protein BWY46_02078 [Firmicutes bacterium ADurb.Bin300]|nr:MAG: hypothetical protein BWY46_02078 [Firmicutes bacterium ADurb.Bin300]